MKVSFHMETLDAAYKFRERLKSLDERIDLGIARVYMMTGKRMEGVSEETYQEIEEVFAIRSHAIYKEMHAHGIAQAKIAGIELADDILDGKSLALGYPQYKEQVPTIGVYELFMPFVVEEIERKRSEL